MKTKHTPGPWKLDGALVTNVAGSIIADANPMARDNNWVKNAQLIAAAPEMLEALRMVKAALEGAAAPSHEAYGLLEVYQAIYKVISKLED